jgi:hypothetical protein
MGITSLSQANAEAATGLVLVATSSFSAASSASINNCFTADYANYRLVVHVNTPSSDGYAQIRLRVGGADATGANYYSAVSGYTTTPSAKSITAAADTFGYLSEVDTGQANGYAYVLDVFGPFATAPTVFTHTASSWVTTGVYVGLSGSLYHTASTSYDGLTVYPSAGTFSGTARVYGYRNAL